MRQTERGHEAPNDFLPLYGVDRFLDFAERWGASHEAYDRRRVASGRSAITLLN